MMDNLVGDDEDFRGRSLQSGPKIIKGKNVGDPLSLVWDWGQSYLWSIEVSYLKPTEELEFKVDMPNSSYVSLGFGYDMRSVDMIAWHGQGDVALAEDYWSTDNNTPKVDEISHLTGT